MKVKEILLEKKKKVDEEVLKHIPNKEPKLHYEMMRDYPSRGGKGLRPGLCLLSCEAYGGNESDALLTAAGLEMFHNWVLIHDDIEDWSDERRGKPCLHKMYGIPLAINAGDALHIKMWEVLLENQEKLGDKKALRVMKEFVKMINETTEGQTYELCWVKKNEWNVTEEDYYTMIKKKTAWYTCITPMRLGGIIAGAPEEDLEKMINFGISLGKAFQIQDDVLNLVGEEEKYGKEIAGDIWEGKRTLILIHLLAKCSPEEKEKVLSIMNKKREDKSEEEVKEILSLMKKHESIEYAKKESLKHAETAKELFKELSMPEPNVKETIESLITFVIEREL
ncbi:polyprenyl synthetase family protein [archaeon]|nr:polyprenyl synthetase family protein [archaeon]